MLPSKFNFYGQGGSGKTTLAVSSMVDIYSGEKRRNGIWMQIGQESNPSLPVPDANVKRFVPDLANPHAVVKELFDFLKALRVSAGKGKSPDILIFDGFTEMDILLGYIYDIQPLEDDKWGEWRYRKNVFRELVQLLDAATLGCHVLSTARVAEIRKGVSNKRTGEVIGADPEFVTSRYFPQMDGWMRYNLPSYANYVFYLETEDGKEGPLHRCHLLQTGDFFIKNTNDHKWPLLKLPKYLDNGTFDQMLDIVEYANKPIVKNEESD